MLAVNCFDVHHLEVLRYAGYPALLGVVFFFIIVAMIPFTIFMSIRNKWCLSFLFAEAFVIPVIVAYLFAESERY